MNRKRIVFGECISLEAENKPTLSDFQNKESKKKYHLVFCSIHSRGIHIPRGQIFGNFDPTFPHRGHT